MWSDNQKRIVCRLAFLLLCALPTVATVYQILHPQTAEQWEQRIQSQLGVRTRIDSVETPGPNETILRGLKFFDAEGHPILEATELRVLFGEVNRVQIDHSIWLTSDGLQHIVGQINERVIRSHSVQPRWIVSIQSAVVKSDSVKDDHFGSLKPRELWLENALIDMDSSIAPETAQLATTARLDFQLVNLAAPTPAGEPNVISCSLRREKIPSANGTNLSEQWINLNTGTDALPCWLASQWLPEITEIMGTEVTFSGALKIDAGSPVLQGQAQGHFDNVDMEQVAWISSDTARTARWAMIDLQSFRFQADEVEHLAFLSVPGDGTPPVRIPTILEVKERFHLARGIHNAALEKYRQASENTIRRRVTYPPTEISLKP